MQWTVEQLSLSMVSAPEWVSGDSVPVITHHGPLPRGSGACFNSQYALTMGRADLIRGSGCSGQGLVWDLPVQPGGTIS